MELVDNPNTVAVIGCGCSSVTEAVASSSNGTILVVSELKHTNIKINFESEIKYRLVENLANFTVLCLFLRNCLKAWWTVGGMSK